MSPYKRFWLVCVVGLAGMAMLLGADPAVYKAALQAGLGLYNENKLGQAEGKFQEAERAAGSDIQRAKARYHLGLVYFQQQKWEQALAALESAEKLDAKTTFTQNVQQYRIKIAQARAHLATESKKATTAPAAPQTSPPPRAVVVKALAGADKGGLWDMADLLNTTQESQILERIRKAAQDSLFFYIVTVDMPAGGRTLSIFTDQLFRERGFKSGDTLLVVSAGGVYGKSVDIADAKLNESIQASRRAFTASYGDGIASLIEDVQSKASRSRSRATAGKSVLLLIVLGIGAVIGFFVLQSRRKKASAFQQKYEEAIKLEAEVLDQLDIVRAKVNLGDETHLKELMDRTEIRYAQAHEAIELLKSEDQKLNVDRAQAVIGLLRGILMDLDRLKSGHGSGEESFAPAGASDLSSAGQVAGDLDGNCFFCSNPVNSQEAERVRITMGDQEQWVLMCRYCADYRRRTGQMPQVLGRTVQGRSVHWKDDPNYKPPSQPMSPQQSGFFGGGGMSFMDMWMLSMLFNQSSHDRVIFVDRDSGQRSSSFSYDVDESRSRGAGSSFRHEPMMDREEERPAPGMDFASEDRS